MLTARARIKTRELLVSCGGILRAWSSDQSRVFSIAFELTDGCSISPQEMPDLILEALGLESRATSINPVAEDEVDAIEKSSDTRAFSRPGSLCRLCQGLDGHHRESCPNRRT
ncbi:hypothetical protein [Sphaerisporangium perillae]|uniref:hypothetical protein n=1 Tax=Sphaerisporangium perillae TaxID=2935860 RepID=UPI00200FABBB|nr:hypothetical protein [Sphaerisporangium perillae]